MKLRSAIATAAVLSLCSCIDPYTPNLKGYQPLFVVDGLLTDANSACKVRLTKTFQEQNSNPEIVADATVFITDDLGNANDLAYTGNGIYKADSIVFRGVIGRTYVLHIQTSEGQVYESEPSLLQPVPEIGNVYYQKDQELINNGTATIDGIRIYVDSKKGEDKQNYKWSFEETWKFKVPTPKAYDYINDSTVLPVADVKDFCYKGNVSDEILVNTTNTGGSGVIKKQPVLFIAPDQSDRLLIQYSILVKQYSISNNEYDFWNNLKQINESGGDIFSKQPFTVISNIKNVNNSAERILGYFQVSSVSEKRLYITFSELSGLKLPLFHYDCVRLSKQPSDYPNSFMAPPPTWDDLYSMFCVTSDFYLVEPLYIPGTNKLQKLIFARPECANCELTGTRKKPDFWVDMK